MTLFEVTSANITSLDQMRLTDLLGRLLHVEAKATHIPLGNLSVSMNIDAPDGGEDGRISWQGGPNSTDFLPNRLTLFQCKATKMDRASCKNEVLIKKKRQSDPSRLKPQVKDVLDLGGAYVLFCS